MREFASQQKCGQAQPINPTRSTKIMPPRRLATRMLGPVWVSLKPLTCSWDKNAFVLPLYCLFFFKKFTRRKKTKGCVFSFTWVYRKIKRKIEDINAENYFSFWCEPFAAFKLPISRLMLPQGAKNISRPANP